MAKCAEEDISKELQRIDTEMRMEGVRRAASQTSWKELSDAVRRHLLIVGYSFLFVTAWFTG